MDRFTRPMRALLMIAFLTACAHTPDAPSSFGADAADAVVARETWRLNGVSQDVLVRGRSVRLPIAIVLHGGPGISETALFRHFVPDLEDDFLMVYWDQPGAGRSYSAAALSRGLSMDVMLSDLDARVDRLRERFGARYVVLIGHSWGSAMGLLYAERHPGKVAAYVGTGQVVDMPAGESLSFHHALNMARARADADAQAALERIGPPPHDVDAMLVSRRMVERFGGVFANGLSTFSLIRAALSTSEATWIDLWRFGAGNGASLHALWKSFSQLDLSRIRTLDVPVILVQGERDRVTPTSLALQRFGQLHAPCKRAVVVQGAAHNVPFEAPVQFGSALRSLSLRLRHGATPAATCGP